MARQKMRMTGVKSAILLACLFTALPAMSANGPRARAQKKPCGIVEPASGPLLVITGKAKAFPFSFRVAGAAREVRFFISGRDRTKGITLLEKKVKVKDGVASSSLSFKVFNGMPLGRQSLAIGMFDADSGANICTGTIPYIVLPGTECMCMEKNSWKKRSGELLSHKTQKTKKIGRNKNA